MSTFYDLPGIGEKVCLFTHLAVREDAQVLYGFVREQDRGLFRTLLKVSGVGGRMALAILSGMDAGQFARCVEQEDLAALMRLPGIGKKTAQRLVIEVKDRLDGLLEAGSIPAGAGAGAGPATGTGGDSGLDDAVSALIALGYKPQDANRMARAVDDGAKTSEQIIRDALRAVGPAR